MVWQVQEHQQGAQPGCFVLACAGGRRDLRDGSRLRRFWPAFSAGTGGGLLRGQVQDQRQVAAHLIAPVDNGIGIEADRIVRLSARKSRARYPDRLRRVSYRAPDTGKRLVLLTNNLVLPARTIADLYKCRWQIELFFKWIKQNLSIRSSSARRRTRCARRTELASQMGCCTEDVCDRDSSVNPGPSPT